MRNFRLQILDNRFLLSSHRVIFWEEEQTMLITDLHLARVGNWRKHGIPVPGEAVRVDLDQLTAATQEFKPRQIVCLGDLFHHKANKEVNMFTNWLNETRRGNLKKFVLIKGNHDMLPSETYNQMDIDVVPKLQIRNIQLVHDPADADSGSYLTISGHIHPGVEIGEGPLRERLPCFYLNSTGNLLILPAFGSSCGTYKLPQNKASKIWAIAGSTLVRVK